jgi:murein DD-endopeptidase MepM/ murein hydrolase activator NlpD
MMRVRILSRFQRNLALGAAVIVIGGFTAGCSSDTARFTDGLTTGSTGSRPVVSPPSSQPFPGDVGPGVRSAPATYGSGVAQPSYRVSSVGHSGLAPVSSGSLPPVSSRNIHTVPANHTGRFDDTVTGSTHRVERQASAVSAAAGKGSHWSRAGGTEITVRQGETVETLSRRFGVPAREILSANGFSRSHRFAAGEKIIIPTFIYGSNAHAADRRVAAASHVDEARHEEPSRKAPVSASRQHVAMLPKSRELREKPSAVDRKTDGSRHEEIHSARAGAGHYKVEPGDSLIAIARKTGVHTAEIRRANNLKTDFLRVGQILTIPGAGGQKVASATAKTVDPVVTGTAGPSKEQKPVPAVAKNESRPAAYTPPQKADKAIVRTEQKEAAVAPETTGIGKMRWPVRGRIITPFGGSGGAASDGIDIAVPEGTPVKAAENGVVIYAGNGLKDFGNTVLIRHEDGLVTVYGHNGKLEVTRGEKVRRGQEIALSGMSGTTPSPRLHFEVRKNSAPVNPTKYLE